MPMGGGSGTSYNDVYFLRLKSPRNEDSFFETRKADGKDGWKDHDPQTWVAGKLVSIKIVDKAFEDMPYQVIQIRLEDDPKILFIVEVRVDMIIGRELLNKLLNVDPLGDMLKLSLYTSEAKEGYDRGFKHISVKFDDAEKGVWDKYDDDKFKGMYEEYKMKGGKTGRDYAAQEAFLVKEIKDKVIPMVASLIPAEASDPESVEEAPPMKSPEPTPQKAEGEQDDLPF